MKTLDEAMEMFHARVIDDVPEKRAELESKNRGLAGEVTASEKVKSLLINIIINNLTDHLRELVSTCGSCTFAIDEIAISAFLNGVITGIEMERMEIGVEFCVGYQKKVVRLINMIARELV